MRNNEVRIRSARKEDVPTISAMVRDSAIAQNAENELCADPFTLLQDGFGTEPRFQCLLAELCDKVVGVILYSFVYSTWTSRNGLFIEDLYVIPQHRRQGIARALMTELARVAINGSSRFIEWMVLRSNGSAIRFYESIGAVALSEWSVMRISGEELDRLVSVDLNSIITTNANTA